MVEFVLPIFLVVLALVLLAAEDLLPTGGALVVPASACLGFALYLGFSESNSVGFRYLAIELVVVPLAFVGYTSLMAKSGLARVAYLQPPEPHEVDAKPDLAGLVGRQGRALTSLRPSGMVDLDGKRLEGRAEFGLIPAGSAVEVVRVASGRLVVREWTEGTA